MHLIDMRKVVLRLVVAAILFVIFFPWMPAKQKWQIRSVFRSREADSLLHEYYEPPSNEAFQFAPEFRYPLGPGRGSHVTGMDVRYIAPTYDGDGQVAQWVMHLKWPTAERLGRHFKTHVQDTLWFDLETDWSIPLDLPSPLSPVYVKWARFGTDPFVISQALEAWQPSS